MAANAWAAGKAPIEQELDGVRKAIEFGRAAQDLRRDEAQTLNAELDALQQRLVEAAAKARGLNRAAAQAEEKLQTLKLAEQAAKHRLRTREDEVANTLRAMVRLQRQPPATLLLHNESIIGAARGNRLLTTALPLLKQDAHALRNEVDALSALQRDIAAESQRVSRAVSDWEGQRAEIAKLLQQRKERARALEDDAQRERKRLAALAARATDLSALLQRLEEQERRRRLQEEERRKREAEAERQRLAAERARRQAEERERSTAERAAAEAQAKAAARGAPPPKEKSLETRLAFSAARGRLTLPVHGRTIRKFGDRSEVGTRMQGITILTRAGAEVVAPHDGHIAFSGPFRDYGVILIIAHGEGYHTLLAGLTETYVEVGQSLLAGEPVGQMGSGKNRTLYVELRRNGEAINPHPWWASNGRRVSG